MVEVNLDTLLAEFFRKAEDFIAAPSITKGLDLDELTGRASSACSRAPPSPPCGSPTNASG